MTEENMNNREGFSSISWPDYCVRSLEDTQTISDSRVELNLEKAEIRYIKNFLEMEGNTASEKDILYLTSSSFKSLEFDSQITPKDIEEIYAMKKALDFLKNNYTAPLTKDHVFMYNFLVVIGVKKADAGRLRETNVWINGTLYTPPKFELLPRLFDNMFLAVDSVQGNLNKAASYLLAISKNQFFIDGNKRTARLVALHQLAYSKQKLISPNLDTVQYMKNLLNFYETSDNSNFAEFFARNLFTL